MFTLADSGLMLEPQLGLGPRRLIEISRQAEDLGFGYLLRSDHLLPTDGRSGIDSTECWTTLGAIALATRRIKFGPLVSPVGFRNPALLAKMASTVHALSSGRLQLALGAGWYEREYRSLGYPFPEFRIRRAQFSEALSIILPMVREGRVDFDGRHFSAHTDCFPRGPQKMHVLIGAKSRGMIALAGRLADEWNALASTPEDFKSDRAILEASAQGRDIVCSVMGPFLIGRDEGDLERNAKSILSNLDQEGSVDALVKRIRSRGSFCGTPEEFVQSTSRMIDAGVQRIYFQALAPENSRMTDLLAETLRDRL